MTSGTGIRPVIIKYPHPGEHFIPKQSALNCNLWKRLADGQAAYPICHGLDDAPDDMRADGAPAIVSSLRRGHESGSKQESQVVP